MASIVVVPEDVIVEILSWLPVKSLLRFRSVCKSWLSIIKNESFVTKHLQHYYHHHSDDQNVRLLLASHTGNRFALRLFSDPTLADTTTFDDLGFSSSQPLTFFGPCNGILCVCNGLDRLALWNPATRDFRPLPKFNPPDFPSSKCFLSTYNVGFGLDPTTGDFKAVFIRRFGIDNEYALPPTYSNHVAVYTDSWREIGHHSFFSDLDVPYGSNSYTYLNGTYYWWAVRGGEEDNPHDMVLAFDMSTDVFRDIPGPDGLPHSSDGILDVYQGSLTRLHVDDTHPVTSIDVWVMMKQDQEEGEDGYCCCNYYWIKKLSVQSVVPGVDMLCGRGIWNNRLLLVLTSSSEDVEEGLYRLGLYDLATGEIKDMGLPELHWFDALMYRDSLVSVKGSNHSIRVPDFGILVPHDADHHTNDDWYDAPVAPEAFY